MSPSRRMDKEDLYIYLYIHTYNSTYMEYYSTIKKDETEQFAVM